MGKVSPNERFGYAEVKVNGMVLELKDISFKKPGIRRDDIDEGNAYVPVKEGGSIKGKAYLKPGQSAGDINKQDQATTLLKDNLNNVHTLSNSWVKNNPDVSKDGFDIEIGVSYGDWEEKIGG